MFHVEMENSFQFSRVVTTEFVSRGTFGYPQEASLPEISRK